MAGDQANTPTPGAVVPPSQTTSTSEPQGAAPYVRARKSRGRVYSPQARACALVLWMRGESLATIHREIGCSGDVLKRWRREEREVIAERARAVYRETLADEIRLRCKLIARQLAVADRVDGDVASKMLERLDSHLAQVLSAAPGPAPSSDVPAAGDLERLVRDFIDRTRPTPDGVVPS